MLLAFGGKRACRQHLHDVKNYWLSWIAWRALRALARRDRPEAWPYVRTLAQLVRECVDEFMFEQLPCRRSGQAKRKNDLARAFVG